MHCSPIQPSDSFQLSSAPPTLSRLPQIGLSCASSPAVAHPTLRCQVTPRAASDSRLHRQHLFIQPIASRPSRLPFLPKFLTTRRAHPFWEDNPSIAASTTSRTTTPPTSRPSNPPPRFPTGSSPEDTTTAKASPPPSHHSPVAKSECTFPTPGGHGLLCSRPLSRPSLPWPSRRMLLPELNQSISVLTHHVSYVFGKFQASVHPEAEKNPHQSATRTIPTYLAVFMFGYLYQLWLVWDALRLKNTIQVIGLVVYNLGILIYAAIQYDQISDAVSELKGFHFVTDNFWADVQPMLIALPCCMAVATILFAFEAWKLYDEFAWTIYKHISADLRLKRRYLTYQV